MTRAVPRAFRPRRLTVSVLQALAVPSMVLLTASAAWAGCSTVAPVAGQTVTCDANAPNPQTVPISASGEAGITVNVASGAQLQQSGGASAVTLVGASGHLLTNQGTISSVGVWRSSSVVAAASKMRAASAPATTPRCSSSERATACWSTAERSVGVPAYSSIQATTAWTCRPAASAAVSCKGMATTCCCWAMAPSTASTRAVAMTG